MNKKIKALYEVMTKDVPKIYPNGLGCTMKLYISPDEHQTVSFISPEVSQNDFIKREFYTRCYPVHTFPHPRHPGHLKLPRDRLK